MTTPRGAEPPGKRAPETALDPGDGTIDHAKNNAVGFSKEELRIVEISPRYRTFVIFRKECKILLFVCRLRGFQRHLPALAEMRFTIYAPGLLS